MDGIQQNKHSFASFLHIVGKCTLRVLAHRSRHLARSVLRQPKPSLGDFNNFLAWRCVWRPRPSRLFAPGDPTPENCFCPGFSPQTIVCSTRKETEYFQFLTCLNFLWSRQQCHRRSFAEFRGCICAGFAHGGLVYIAQGRCSELAIMYLCLNSANLAFPHRMQGQAGSLLRSNTISYRRQEPYKCNCA